MPYYGNTGQKAESSETTSESEKESMPQFQVFYDSPSGSGAERVRAVNGREAEKIIKNGRGDKVITDSEMVEV